MDKQVEQLKVALQMAQEGLVVWVPTAVAAQICGLDPQTLKRIRLGLQTERVPLLEGVHWVRHSSRCVRFNNVLISDWGANRNNPVLHQKAVDRYLASLPSNQPAKTRRKAS